MKLSDRFEVRGQRGNYILTEYYLTKNPKTGEEVMGEKNTYHPTLEQVSTKITKIYGQEALELGQIDIVTARLARIERDVRGAMLEVKP